MEELKHMSINIEYVHICDRVIVGKNEGLSIIDTFDKIIAPSFPAVHLRLTVVVGIRGPKGEYSLTVSIINKDNGKTIVRGESVIGISKNGDAARFFGQFNGIRFEHSGEHQVVVNIDNQVRKLPLMLEKSQDK